MRNKSKFLIFIALSKQYSTNLAAQTSAFDSKTQSAQQEVASSINRYMTFIWADVKENGARFGALSCLPENLDLEKKTCIENGTVFIENADRSAFLREILARAEFGTPFANDNTEDAVAIRRYTELRPHTLLGYYQSTLQKVTQSFYNLNENLKLTVGAFELNKNSSKSILYSRLQTLQKQVLEVENRRDLMRQSLQEIDHAAQIWMDGIEKEPIIKSFDVLETEDGNYQSYFSSLFSGPREVTLQSGESSSRIVLNKFSEGVAWVRVGRVHALIDRLGKVRIQLDNAFMLDSDPKFTHGLSPVYDSKLSYYYIDINGKIPSNFQKEFSYAKPFNAGVAVVKDKNGKFGLLTLTGDFHPEFGPEFDKIEFGPGTRNSYQKGNEIGYISQDLKKIPLPTSTYGAIFPAQKKYLVFLSKERTESNNYVYHFFDLETGNLHKKFSLSYELAEGIFSNMSYSSETVGFTDDLGLFSGEFLRFKGRLYWWDEFSVRNHQEKGFSAYKYNFDETPSRDIGTIVVEREPDRWQFLRLNGYPPRQGYGYYKFAEPFHEELAHVVKEKDGKTLRNFIDMEHKIKFPKLTFSDLGSFGSGLAYARTEKSTGYMNRYGYFEIRF